MTDSCGNIYKKARRDADLKREPAAEELGIDVRTLDNYESIGKHPPDDIVQKMCDLYNNRYLGYLHMKSSVLGGILPEVPIESFKCSTLNLLKEIGDVNGKLNNIINIASNGVVDDYQEDDWRHCEKELWELAGALLGVIYSSEQRKE